MKTINLFLMICSLFLFSYGCKNEEKMRQTANDLFISKFSNKSFEQFANCSAGIRSWEDRGQSVCILVSTKAIDSGICGLPYAVIIDVATGKVKTTRRGWTDSSATCPLDTALAIKMALAVNDSHIFGLSVDSNRTVYVKTIYKEGYGDLVKFSSPEFVTKEYKEEWAEKRNGWYERIKF